MKLYMRYMRQAMGTLIYRYDRCAYLGLTLASLILLLTGKYCWALVCGPGGGCVAAGLSLLSALGRRVVSLLPVAAAQQCVQLTGG